MAPDGIVGRDRELASIDGFLAEVGTGAAAFLLEGEAGIGKTTLWLEAVRRAASSGMHVLTSRPGERDARLTFAGLSDLVAGVGDATLEQIPEAQRRALDAALARASHDAPLPDQRFVSAAFLSLLRALSASAPVVVAVDDLQWLDRPSTDVLEFALRRLGDDPVGLVCGLRADSAPSWRTALGGALHEGRVHVMHVGPLSLSAIHEVLLARLGHAFPRPVLVRIEQASGGNPFFSLELARALVEGGAPVTGSAPLPVPENLLELIDRRLRRLRAATRHELLLLAASSSATVEQLDVAALAAAEDAALVHIAAGGRVTFTHPLFASAVYSSAAPGRRRDAHRTLAARARDAEERARHLALASPGPDAEVARALDTAAEEARARGAASTAAELAELARDLTPPLETDDVLRRTTTLADHLLHAGGDARARELLEDALAAAPPGQLRCEALASLGLVLWGCGEWEVGIRLCEDALQAAEGRALEARLHAQLASMFEMDVQRAARHARAALDLLDEAEDPVGYAAALLSAAQWQFFAGQGLDPGAVDRGATLQEAAGSWEISTLPAGLARNADDFETARARYETYLRRAEEQGDELRRCIVLAHLATLECWLGDLARGESLARESLQLVAQTGQLAYQCVALHALATVDAHLGRAGEARAAAERILELLRDQPDPILELMAHALLGFVAVSLAEPAVADPHFARAAELLESMGWREPAPFRFQGDQIEAAVALGQLDRADTLLAELDARNRVFRRPWLAAVSARCRSILLAARGDLGGAEEALEEALAEHEAVAMPLELGRTLLCLGQVRRRRRQMSAARESLRAALGLFEEARARLWAERARAELERTHVREAPAGLTPTEERIAELAAEGLTNKAIAERLFVSPKTVEGNLARAYRKLGIRSRAELGRVMAERAATAET